MKTPDQISKLFLSALLTAGLAAFSPVSPAYAQEQTLRIVAVVNDDAISEYDLFNRIGLVIALSNLPNRADVQRQLAPQVLRSLIDERLKFQAARETGITAAPEVVERTLNDIAQRNRMSLDDMLERLIQRGVDPEALINQITADVLWGQTISRRFGYQANITEAALEIAVQEDREAFGKPEYEIAEIFLAEDENAGLPDIKRQASQLVQQLRNGASFPALAQSFSQLPTARNGGIVGWVRPGQIVSEVATAIQNMQRGDISEPIPVTGGLYIIALRNIRIAGQRTTGIAEVGLTQFHLSVPSDTPENIVQQYMASAREQTLSINGCEAFGDFIQEAGSPTSGDLGVLPLNQLPEPIRNLVSDIKIGAATPPIRRDDAIIVLMVCERTVPEVEMVEIDPQQIRMRLRNERLDNFARRYLREIRRTALIDIRI